MLETAEISGVNELWTKQHVKNSGVSEQIGSSRQRPEKKSIVI